jgi:hypothetical protein
MASANVLLNFNFSDNIDYIKEECEDWLLSFWTGITYYFNNKVKIPFKSK